MVCANCESKLRRLVTPTPYGARAAGAAPGAAGAAGPQRRAPAGRAQAKAPQYKACRICRTKVHQVGSHYCQACAYKKGICAMCGKKLLDIKNYRQSST